MFGDNNNAENADYLFPTQTPDPDSLSAPATQDGMDIPIKMPWGRLFSCVPWLDTVDLVESSFKVGRSEYCDVVITLSRFPENQSNRFTTISKYHFSITKDVNSLVYITDLSKNGTYVNGDLIGRHNRYLLQNDDIISVGFKHWKAYIFKTMTSENNDYLPYPLKKIYLVSTLLGRGACGEVRLVFHKSTCRSYAIKKIMKPRYVSSGQFCINDPAKINTEIEILKSISHPFIMGMKEIIESDEAFYLVLDYMPGGELTSRILSKEPLTEFQAKRLFYQIAVAVQYLHRNNITHRDLKAENVLLSSPLDDAALIKVSDFGLSKIIHNDTIMQTQCGTPSYVAPEVLSGNIKQYDQKVDVWSLGVILYYMLSQQLPFCARDKRELYDKIIKGDYTMDSPRWAGISKEAQDLIKRMLTVPPWKRIRMDDVLLHPWIGHDTDMMNRVHTLVTAMYPETVGEFDFEIPAKRRRM